MFQPPSDVHSPVTVSPLLANPDETPVETIIGPKSEEVYDPRIKLSPNNQALSEEPEEERTSEDPYMGSQNLDSDPEEPEMTRSPYECRAVVVELDPEDHVEGYRA